MLLGFCRFRLDRLDAFHFAAHESAVALVEIGDFQDAIIAKFAGCGFQKQIC